MSRAFVLDKYLDAVCERPSWSNVYEIHEQFHGPIVGIGRTEDAAWSDAAKIIASEENDYYNKQAELVGV